MVSLKRICYVYVILAIQIRGNGDYLNSQIIETYFPITKVTQMIKQWYLFYKRLYTF